MHAEILWVKCHGVSNLLSNSSAKIKCNLYIEREEVHMATLTIADSQVQEIWLFTVLFLRLLCMVFFIIKSHDQDTHRSLQELKKGTRTIYFGSPELIIIASLDYTNMSQKS